MLYPKIKTYCDSLPQLFEEIGEKHHDSLNKIAEYIQKKINNNGAASLVVICTHNSRRSHFGQIWLQVAATYYGIKNIKTYSGGTEATAFHPNAVAALERVGFEIEKEGESNPKYKVAFAENEPAQVMFSKKFDDSPNPNSAFSAIMVCSEADANCPFVPGTELRISLPFEDPKEFDGTSLEAAKYDERCRQIASEMFYVMSQIV